MKKVKIILLVLSSVFLLVFIGTWIFTSEVNNSPCNSAPERIVTIPNSAIWKGSCQEGFWLDLIDVNVTAETYRIKIYNDYNGELVYDADFIKEDSCMVKLPLNKDVLKSVSYFEINRIIMNDDCVLKMITPAYGGTFWELDKLNK